MVKNKVVAGDYVGFQVAAAFGVVSIITGFGKQVQLNSETVESYELMTDEHRKSAASGVARGLVGGFLLGGIGILAGGLSAKEKGRYQIALQFKDEKKSLLDVDGKIYKTLVKCCF